jgi:hypothetical protein
MPCMRAHAPAWHCFGKCSHIKYTLAHVPNVKGTGAQHHHSAPRQQLQGVTCRHAVQRPALAKPQQKQNKKNLSSP